MIEWARGSWRRILFDVVPSTRRDIEDRDVSERRGAVNGVDEIGWEDGVSRS